MLKSNAKKSTPSIILLAKRLLSNNQDGGLKQYPRLAIEYYDKFPSYCEMVKHAKGIARRSILIEHTGVKMIDLEQFTDIDRVFLISNKSKRNHQFDLSLIEFKTDEAANRAAGKGVFQSNCLPIASRFFRYRGGAYSSKSKLQYPIEEVSLPYRSETDTQFSTFTQFVSQNMMSLAALRLKFVTLVNLERSICSGLLENYELMPFGSSANHIGSDTGDLDLMMTPKHDHDAKIDRILSKQKHWDQVQRSSLYHLEKPFNPRSDSRMLMKHIHTMIREYVPFVNPSSVIGVYNATVPILKFSTLLSTIDCDLGFEPGGCVLSEPESQKVYSGVVMSHCLFQLCKQSNLVTALLIYLRIYCKLTDITCKGGTRRLTNFQLLSLILFYLQRRELTLTTNQSNRSQIKLSRAAGRPRHSIVPPFDQIRNPISPVHLNDDQLNEILPKIIVDFFAFYSHLDYNKFGLDMCSGRITTKPDNSSIYVVNPIDRSRNVCYNVTSSAASYFSDQVNEFLRVFRRNDTNSDALLKRTQELISRVDLNQEVNGVLENIFEDGFGENKVVGH